MGTARALSFLVGKTGKVIKEVRKMGEVTR
jgi:hypothetical protein